MREQSILLKTRALVGCSTRLYFLMTSAALRAWMQRRIHFEDGKGGEFGPILPNNMRFCAALTAAPVPDL